MKIVMAVHHYPPGYVAGVELIAQRTAQWLLARGHSVEVVAVERIDGDNPLTVRTDLQEGVVVHRLGLKLTGGKEPLGLRFRDDLLGDWFEDYLNRTRPDLFHSQSCYLITASGIEAAKRSGIPVVITLHDYWFLCPRLTLMRPDGRLCLDRPDPLECAWCLMTERRRYRLVDGVARWVSGELLRRRDELRFPVWMLHAGLLSRLQEREAHLQGVLRAADGIISPVPYTRELLARKGYPSAGITLVSWGLDLRHWQGLPRIPRNSSLRIGYLGQLAPHKGVHLLIQAFQRLCSSQGAALELNIYGDPSRFPRYADSLEMLARGNPGIRFHGGYDNRQVESILAGLDVVVLPSVWLEISPLVVLEAFAARVPVVASRLPNMQFQIRDGIDGLLFEAGNADDLASQLERLIRQPGLLSQLASGIRPVRTVDEEMLEIERVYGSVAGARTIAAGCGCAERMARAQ